MRYLILLLLLVATPSFATDYYVATDGNDGDAGSIGAPWLTIQKAADTMVAGDTVYVRGGTYAPSTGEGDCISVCAIKPKSGTEGNPITYTEYPSESVIIDMEDELSPHRWFGFYMIAKHYVTIEGFEIKNISADAGIWVSDDSSNIIIDGVEIHHIDGTLGNNIAGVVAQNVSYLTVKNSSFHDNTGTGVQDNNNVAGILSLSGFDYAVIENNEIYNVGMGVFNKRSEGNKGAIIRDNVIHDIDKDGIFYSVAGVGDNPLIDGEVYRNIIYNLTAGQYAINAILYETVTQSIGLDIYNNVLDAPNGISIRGVKEVNIKNNIFYNNTGRSINQFGPASENSIDSADYNLYYANENFRLLGGEGGEETYTTLSGWVAGTIYGDNSLNSDPLFTNPGANDYTLQVPDSPAIDAGVDVGLAFNGSAPDMGAFETDGEAPPEGTEGRTAGSGDIDELGW
jgi:hypothetical protein